MKKKFLAVVLGMTMMMSLVACGGTDNIETDGGDVSVTVEADGAGDGEDVGDGSTIEDSGEIAEIEVLENGSYDYDKDYTVDMLVEAMPQDNVYMYVETMGIGLGVGKSGENATIVINMEDANTGSEMGMDLYIMGQDMYSYVHDSSQNMSIYQHAVVPAEEGAGDIVGSLTEETDMDLSNITSVEYVETLVENGIAYDVVQVEETVEGVSDGVTVEINGELQEPVETYTAVSSYYIDVETGIVDRVVSVTDGVETIMNIDVIDGIELPAGFSENEVVEVPAEDLMMQLFGVMMVMTESTTTADDVPEAGVEVEIEDGAAIDGFEGKDAK
mgnify:CR=1 FL=1